MHKIELPIAEIEIYGKKYNMKATHKALEAIEQHFQAGILAVYFQKIANVTATSKELGFIVGQFIKAAENDQIVPAKEEIEDFFLLRPIVALNAISKLMRALNEGGNTGAAEKKIVTESPGGNTDR